MAVVLSQPNRVFHVKCPAFRAVSLAVQAAMRHIAAIELRSNDLASVRDRAD
jgi:hypothetical protein